MGWPRGAWQPPPIFGTTKTSEFSTNTKSRLVSVVLYGVLGPPRLARQSPHLTVGALVSL